MSARIDRRGKWWAGGLLSLVLLLGVFLPPHPARAQTSSSTELCTFKILRILQERKDLRLPTHAPKMTVESPYHFGEEEFQELAHKYREYLRELDQLTRAIKLTGAIIDRSKSRMIRELLKRIAPIMSPRGHQLPYMNAYLDAIFKGIEQIGQNRAVVKAHFTIPYEIVDVWLFEARICLEGRWHHYEGLYIWRKRTGLDLGKEAHGDGFDIPSQGPNKQASLHAARAEMKKLFGPMEANLQSLSRLLIDVRQSPDMCRLILGPDDFTGVPGPDAPPYPELKDCDKIKRELDRLRKQYSRGRGDCVEASRRYFDALDAWNAAGRAVRVTKAEIDRMQAEADAPDASSDPNFIRRKMELERMRRARTAAEKAELAEMNEQRRRDDEKNAEARKKIRAEKRHLEEMQSELSSREYDLDKAKAERDACFKRLRDQRGQIDELEGKYLKCQEFNKALRFRVGGPCGEPTEPARDSETRTPSTDDFNQVLPIFDDIQQDRTQQDLIPMPVDDRPPIVIDQAKDATDQAIRDAYITDPSRRPRKPKKPRDDTSTQTDGENTENTGGSETSDQTEISDQDQTSTGESTENTDQADTPTTDETTEQGTDGSDTQTDGTQTDGTQADGTQTDGSTTTMPDYPKPEVETVYEETEQHEVIDTVDCGALQNSISTIAYSIQYYGERNSDGRYTEQIEGYQGALEQYQNQYSQSCG